MRPVAVIGGGWAGLTAAVELTAAGVPVTVFEAARQLGGRARTLDWQGIAIDNGQHILSGAYRETLRLMHRVGALHRLDRRRLDLNQPPAFRLSLPAWPAPLHLAWGLTTARGLAWRDKLAAARFMQCLKAQHYRLPADRTLADLLDAHRQPEPLRRLLWEPICLAALNTPMAQASAQVFCNVLRDALGGSRAESDFLLPRADLGQLFPVPAAQYIRRQGGEVLLQARIEKIKHDAAGFWLGNHPEPYARVICAVHPAQGGELLAALPETADLRRQLTGLNYQPIQTVWLRFAEAPAFPAPMLGLGDGPGQWAFERSDLAPRLASVVISAEGPHLAMDKSALVERILAQLRQAIGPLPALADSLLITEKRATFAATPGLKRPENRTGLPGLLLAGDYTESDYPATLEGAVRSGVQCARILLEPS